MKKRTKIVCTIGPASEHASTLASMMKAGMDAARLNFSHGTYKQHAKSYRTIRSVANKLGRSLAIIGDLQGPKIRLGNLPEEGVMLRAHDEIQFSTAAIEFKKNVFPVTYGLLHKDVKAGERLLIDDGLIETHILEVKGKTIRARVINGGNVTSHKGMNFPDSKLRVSAITEKDRADVAFMVPLGVDWIVLSFVTNPTDVKTLRRLVKQAAKPGQILPRIMAKIEKHEAIDRLHEILAVVDGAMIGRGDLGVEVPMEMVPIYQKEIIDMCRAMGKPVIVATQMLESMRSNPKPTRAEVSDVANAVFDHTDAVMLSAETATGSYPVQTVTMMAKIAEQAEQSPYDNVLPETGVDQEHINTLSESIHLGHLQNEIDAVLVSLELAPWSETIFQAHPKIPFFVACPKKEIAQQVVLRWGSIPFIHTNAQEKTFVARSITALKKHHHIKKATRLAVVMGGSHGRGFDVVQVP